MSKEFYLDMVQENELPSFQMCTDSNIHVLDSSSLQPSSRILKSFGPPHSGRPIESEEVKEHTINLLLHLKMERQIDVLQPCEKILIFVYKRPSNLHKTKLWISLQSFIKKQWNNNHN